MTGIIDPQDLMDRNALAAEAFDADRRGFVKHGLLFTAALGFWTPGLAQAAPATVRTLRLTNIHTGESFKGEYWRNGRYIPAAFREIKTLMRDRRTDQKFPIDPRLMDVLYVLHKRTGNANPFQIYSGYRSPQSNAYLRRHSHGVARNSLHMQGQAADIGQEGTRIKALRAAALALHAGGVGYYPSSDFLHVDTGRVRAW